MNSKLSKLPSSKYLFLLGQNQALSIAEIKSVFANNVIDKVDANFVSLNLAGNPLSKINRLGGTTKVAQFVTCFTTESLIDQLVDQLAQKQSKNFSLTFLNYNHSLSQVAFAVKSKLSYLGFRKRFINAPAESLSPLIITKQHVTEYVVDFKNKEIFSTIWVHEFKDWIKRDRYKPYIDARAGMLPPKLARIIVNLALGNSSSVGKTLLDPFCGTGTVLMEGLLLGIDVVGADLSNEQLVGAKQNLRWLNKIFPQTIHKQFTLIKSDATHLSETISSPIDFIVTEPFLGPFKFSDAKIPNIVKGLQKLYLGALKDWVKFLPPKAKVVMIFPQFQIGKKVYQTSQFLDEKVDLGYNLLVKDLLFTRPGAHLVRQIVILEKN